MSDDAALLARIRRLESALDSYGDYSRHADQIRSLLKASSGAPAPISDDELMSSSKIASNGGSLISSRDDAVRSLLDALAMPDGRSVRLAWDHANLLFGRYGSVLQRAAFESYLEEVAQPVGKGEA